ncbi:MAG: EAL domain-containing protein [Gammaproteobacteria bacterium]|nr:EAL domain-containing protein [Gammaproteobacteria bacterium]
MKIKIWVLTAIFVFFAFVGSGIYTLSNYKKELLLNTRFEQLISLREALGMHINTYQKQTKNILRSISLSSNTSTALKQLSPAFQALQDIENIQNLDTVLTDEYQERYLNNLHRNIPNAAPGKHTQAYLPTQKQGKIAQYNQIIKQGLIINKQSYDILHDQFHPHFKQIQKIHDFYDLFLIDPQGNIIYSVEKEFDYGTNLLTGPYKKSGLAEVFRKSTQTKKNELSFATFLPYEPSLNIPAAFLAMPIYIDKQYYGSIAIQLPIEPINQIMTFHGKANQSGLGESGEAYIIGNDFTMRNDSRFLNDINHPLVQKLQTTIGIQHVKTPGVIAGLKGEKNQQIFLDYRGISVLSAYTSYQLFGEPSVLLVEIDKQEVFNYIDAVVNRMILAMIIVMLILSSIVLFFFKNLIIYPLNKLNDTLKTEVNEQKKQVVINSSLLNEYKKAVDMSAIVSKADIKGNITYVNEAFCNISGYSRKELIGSNHRIINNPKVPKTLFKDLWQTISAKKTWKGIICNKRKDGTEYYVSSTIVPILSVNGDLKEYISIRTDVTEIFNQQQQIMMHTTDSLTKLPNRQKFIELLSQSKTPLLAIFNIDRFSEINDYYGYAIGDEVIISFATMLSEHVNEGITVFRLSGDEFVLLAKDNFPENKFAAQCKKILSLLDKKIFTVNDNELTVSATVGVASESRNAYINAGMALRVAKESHQQFLFYNSHVDLQKRNEENLRWTKKIKQAIANDKITLFIQPIVDRCTKKIDKYECLMRLIDEDGSEISPFFFLDIAKNARLYSQLSEIIINKSFDYFSNRTESFSINLTIEDILNKDTTKLLKQKLSNESIAKRVIFEIVESEGIENYTDVSDFIREMKYLGCAIAIDDFGTGYSNFEYLMKLDPNFIKIDGSMIKNIAHDETVFRVTTLIHEFSQSIGTKTIAEFVSDKVIAEKVKEIGIDYMQGYLLGKPEKAI